jgi:phosphoesterase RecJ-like protein
MTESIHQVIRRQFEQAQQISIVSHVRPDGDAVSSILGLGMALQAAGKNVQMVLADGVPTPFRYLPGSDQIKYRIKGTPDLVIVCDCSDLVRTGNALGDLKPHLNIDHHVTNLLFADINLVETAAVATAAILTSHMAEWGLAFSEEIASCLLTGLIADSLGFRTSNMNPQALRLAADLMERGANLPDLYYKALVRRSFEAARFWGTGLEHLQRDGRLVWTTLRLDDRKTAQYPGNDDADLVNMISTIEDGDIVIMFVEQKEGRVKISWRAQPGWDVSRLALQFGGGGHPAAAGAEVKGTVEEVQEKVLQATRTLLTQQNGNHSLPAAQNGRSH